MTRRNVAGIAVVSPDGAVFSAVNSSSIYTKLGVTNRAGAALRAMEFGIVGAAPVVA